jgi:hypothetical protein
VANARHHRTHSPPNLVAQDFSAAGSRRCGD